MQFGFKMLIFLFVVFMHILFHTESAELNENPNKLQLAHEYAPFHFAKSGQFPFSVMINDVTRTRLCGGVIIGRYYVLTIAECAMFVLKYNKTYTIAGINNMKTAKVERKIKEVKIHPKYVAGNNTYYNIALLEMEKTFFFCRRVYPIKLFDKAIEENSEGKICGWGTALKNYQDNTLVTDNLKMEHAVKSIVLTEVSLRKSKANYTQSFTFSSLKYRSVTIINQSLCIKLYELKRNITIEKSHTICAGVSDDGCLGFSCDIGGPLMVNNRLVGLQLGAIDVKDPLLQYCGRMNKYPGVFLNVSYFKDWIEVQLAQHNKSSIKINISAITIILMLILLIIKQLV